MIIGSEIIDCYYNGIIFQFVYDFLDNNKFIDDLFILDRGWWLIYRDLDRD